jgi:hypothetical protein
MHAGPPYGGPLLLRAVNARWTVSLIDSLRGEGRGGKGLPHLSIYGLAGLILGKTLSA